MASQDTTGPVRGREGSQRASASNGAGSSGNPAKRGKPDRFWIPAFTGTTENHLFLDYLSNSEYGA